MANWFLTRVPSPFSEEKKVSSKDGDGTTELQIQNNEIGPLPHNIYNI